MICQCPFRKSGAPHHARLATMATGKATTTERPSRRRPRDGIHRPEGSERVLTAASRAQEPDGDAAERHHHRVLGAGPDVDRKSTRLNSSHVKISYAVFCLK